MRSGHDTRNTYKHGLLYGPKGNRIYDKPVSPTPPQVGRRNTNHMPDSTWSHDSGIPPCMSGNCD